MIQLVFLLPYLILGLFCILLGCIGALEKIQFGVSCHTQVCVVIIVILSLGKTTNVFDCKKTVFNAGILLTLVGSFGILANRLPSPSLSYCFAFLLLLFLILEMLFGLAFLVVRF